MGKCQCTCTLIWLISHVQVPLHVDDSHGQRLSTQAPGCSWLSSRTDLCLTACVVVVLLQTIFALVHLMCLLRPNHAFATSRSPAFFIFWGAGGV